METEGNMMESYDRLKLSEPLSGSVPETVSVSYNLIVWTRVTGNNRNRSLEPLAESRFHDFTRKILRSGRFLPYSFNLDTPKFQLQNRETSYLKLYSLYLSEFFLRTLQHFMVDIIRHQRILITCHISCLYTNPVLYTPPINDHFKRSLND